jgi:PAS domain S-box-containing protein
VQHCAGGTAWEGQGRMAVKILVVEHQPPDGSEVVRTIRTHGYAVDTACSGKEAVRKLERDPEIALVVTDIDLDNGMDGLETVRRMLERIDLPVVFLTGRAEKEYLEKTKGLHGFGCVQKSSGAFVLMGTVETALRLFETQQRLKKEIEERKRTEKALRESDHLKSTVLDNAGEIIAYHDTQQRIQWANRAYAEATGLSLEEIQGTLCYRVWKLGALCSACPVTEALKTGEPQLGEMTPRNQRQWPEEQGSWLVKAAPVRDEAGTVIGAVELALDITEREKTKHELEESEERYRTILNAIPDLMFIQDRDGTYLDYHAYDENALYVSPAHFLGKNVQEVLPDEISSKFLELYDQALSTKEVQFFEYELMIAGERRFFEARISPYGEEKVLTIVREITERKRAEEEREFLMRELNHRVKNNLAMISSLIHLKCSEMKEEIDLSDIIHQIDAIRIVHEKLQQANEIAHVELRDYILDILSTVFESFAAHHIEVEEDIESLTVRTRNAVPIGLIVNEIATNAIKYGFTGQEEARFTIGMHEHTDEGVYRLIISNSGPPFPEGIDLEDPQTLGMRLIRTLVQQLDGTVDLQKRPHPEFTIRIPVEEE